MFCALSKVPLRPWGGGGKEGVLLPWVSPRSSSQANKKLLQFNLTLPERCKVLFQPSLAPGGGMRAEQHEQLPHSPVRPLPIAEVWSQSMSSYHSLFQSDPTVGHRIVLPTLHATVSGRTRKGVGSSHSCFSICLHKLWITHVRAPLGGAPGTRRCHAITI